MSGNPSEFVHNSNAREAKRHAKPFLRWAGSKRKQLAHLRTFWSDSHTGYAEPFAGSACLFFSLAPDRAVLGDSNRELIEVYRVVRDNPDGLYNRLSTIRRDLNTYNRWRSWDPRTLDRDTRALRLVYLNRNCFNGIYRTNTDGHFNVPNNALSKLTGLSEPQIERCKILIDLPERFQKLSLLPDPKERIPSNFWIELSRFWILPSNR